MKVKVEPEDSIDESVSNKGEGFTAINKKIYDEPVDDSLFATAAKLLEEHENAQDD